jgi:hypothetical protein
MGGDPKLQGLALSADTIKLREQLAEHETNARSTNIVIGCLVKRLGAVFVEGRGHGYRVLITDEEMQSLEGGLEVVRDVGASAIVLTLHALQPAVIETAETEGA